LSRPADRAGVGLPVRGLWLNIALLAVLSLWPMQGALAQGDHANLPTRSELVEMPRHRPEKAAKAEKSDAAASTAAADKPIGLDEVARRVSDKVIEVRERQARAQTRPASRSGSSAHGTTTALADKRGKSAEVGAADAAAHLAHDIHWAYSGEGGPSRWAELKPEYAFCGKGLRQSPIDIRGGLKVDLDPIKFDYRPVPFGVIDNGHTIQANLQPGNAIEINGRRYDLLQFHFHRPSEERVNGRLYDMVVHLVHRDAEGRLAVVAVLIEAGRPHPVVQAVWNNLPLERNDELPASAPIDLSQLLPDDRRYYTYMGSLTTPPCSEGVLWMVLKQPATLSPEQIGLFARLYPMNARPLQQTSGRMIKESN
jgi:carbonic anhydrase